LSAEFDAEDMNDEEEAIDREFQRVMSMSKFKQQAKKLKFKEEPPRP